ncbi:MAG: TlpA family protein disulfide reductase [Bacteroidales bacterium]
MKKNLLKLICLLAILYSCNTKEKKEQQTIDLDVKNSTLIFVGQSVPDFSFVQNNDTVQISDLKGKVVFMDFFAMSCPICIKELPIIHTEIWQKYNLTEDFEFFVFGRGHTIAEIDSFRTKWEYTFDIISDLNKAIYTKFATKYIPRNIILNREGEIIFEATGFDDEKFAEIKAILEKELHIN